MILENTILQILDRFKNGLTKRELTKILNTQKITFNSSQLKEILWHKLIPQKTILYQKDDFKFVLQKKIVNDYDLISDFIIEFELFKSNFNTNKTTNIDQLLSKKDNLVDQIISKNVNIDEIEAKLETDQKQFLFLDRRLHIHINTFKRDNFDEITDVLFNPLVEFHKLANEFYSDGKITQNELLILEKYCSEFEINNSDKQKIISNAIEKNKNNFNLDYLLYFHLNTEKQLSHKQIIESFLNLYQIELNDSIIDNFLNTSPKTTENFDYQLGQFTYKIKPVPYSKISSTYLFDMLRVNNTHYELRINEIFASDPTSLSHIVCDAIAFEYCTIMELGIDDFLEYKKLILQAVTDQCNKS